MGDTKRCQRVRRRQYKENPYCPLCGVKMIEAEVIPGYPNIKFPPDNMVVYAHRKSRINPNRGDFGKLNYIICNKCANKHAAIQEREYLTIDEMRKRSGRLGINSIN